MPGLVPVQAPVPWRTVSTGSRAGVELQDEAGGGAHRQQPQYRNYLCE